MELTITELTNIPKLSGSTYVSWKIKDISAHGVTEKSHIHRYRSSWNYKTVETMRISINSRGQLQDKFIKFKVYSQNHSHNSLHGINTLGLSDHRKEREKVVGIPAVDTDVTHLGDVKINLSEFANFPDEAVSRRYLLENCKVNCILNIQISLRVVSGDFKSFMAPPVKYKGLSSMLASSEHQSSAIGESSSGGDSNTIEPSVGLTGTSYYYQNLAILSDPIMMKLYNNTFQIAWDERPGEFSPPECIEDIFHGGDGWAKNEEGQRLIDLGTVTCTPEREKYNRRNSMDRHNSISSGSGSTYSGSHCKERERSRAGGSLNEFEIRGELRSWNVSHIRD